MYLSNGLKQLIIIITVLWISMSCEKLDRLTQFHLDYTETITIPAALGLNLPFNIFTPSIKTNTKEVFEINDTRKNLVEEVFLEKLSLNIIDPANSDFDFLRSIEVYMETDSSDLTLIAWKYDIDNSIGTVLDLEVSDENLLPFILQDDFILKVTTVTDEIPMRSHEIEIESSFFVNARIFGI